MLNSCSIMLNNINVDHVSVPFTGQEVVYLNCNNYDQILTSIVFLQFTSFSLFHFLSQDTINWSAPMYGSSKLCTETVMHATGPNPVEAPN